MQRWIALLRGVNVGGHRRIPMEELRDVARAAGLAEVSTYIQSGNLLFTSDQNATQISAQLRQVIEERFGFVVPVVLRESEHFSSIAEAHPFQPEESDDRRLMVAFLDRIPSSRPAESLPAEEFAPDTYIGSGSELYIHYPEGSARSKLTPDVIDRRLGVTSTMRNWRTVRNLAEISFV